MPSDTDLVFSPKLAAQYLAGHLGEAALLWNHRLANWRRPGRSGPIKARLTEAGYPVYAADELQAFVAQHRADGGFAALSEGDRPRVGAVANLDGMEPHVRLAVAIGAVSQSVFAIEADAARGLARMLVNAAEAVEAVQRARGEAA